MARRQPFDYEVPYGTDGGLMHFPQTVYDYSPVMTTHDCPAGECPQEQYRQDPSRYPWGLMPMCKTTRHGERIEYPPTWKPNDPFQATLRLDPHLGRGRSAKYVFWADGEIRHPMFVADFVVLVRTVQIEKGGIVTGLWRARKRGENYGLIFWEEVQ